MLLGTKAVLLLVVPNVALEGSGVPNVALEGSGSSKYSLGGLWSVPSIALEGSGVLGSVHCVLFNKDSCDDIELNKFLIVQAGAG